MHHRISALPIIIYDIRNDDIFFRGAQFANGKRHILSDGIRHTEIIFNDEATTNELRPYIPDKFPLRKKFNSLLEIVLPNQRRGHENFFARQIIERLGLGAKGGIVPTLVGNFVILFALHDIGIKFFGKRVKFFQRSRRDGVVVVHEVNVFAA